MKISEVTQYLESIAPQALQESYDNSGLIIGNPNTEITGVLICIDITNEVLDEALALGYNLIIAHHPLVFGGLKRFNGNGFVEPLVIKTIKNDLAIYAGHTNFDSLLHQGVNAKMAEILGLIQTKILSPAKELLNKIVVFVPLAQAEAVRQAMFDAGAGHIGNYSHCSYNLNGDGTFMAGIDTNPFVGEKNKLHTEPEVRIETITPRFLTQKVINSMLKAHPYEEPAYDIYPLQNRWEQAGSGFVGNLPEPMAAVEFIKLVKEKFEVGCIRHTRLPETKIKKVAICGGSGSFLLNDAIRCGADIFITADIKYHQFFDAPYPFILADIGHYESEQFTKELFYELLIGKFSNFAVRITKINTNPIKYV